jgi:hypothetical protein
MMKRGKTLLTSLAITLLMLGLSACEQEGPAERAGEKVDAAAERAKEAVDPKGPAERAGEEADEAMERAEEATEERTQQ